MKIHLLIFRIACTFFCCILQSFAFGQSGLKAEYFNGYNFDTFVTQRTDATIDFNWGIGEPVSGVSSGNFSVRWSGTIKPRYTETYKFVVKGTHAWRIWINGVLLWDRIGAESNGLDYDADFKADNFWSQESETSLRLKANVRYDLKFEYVKKDQGEATPAEVRFYWISNSQAWEIVPNTQLENTTSGTKATQARKAREFYENIGIVFQKVTEADYATQKSWLDELDIFSVRHGFYPTSREQTWLIPRFNDLYNTIGVKSVATCREGWYTNDGVVMMSDIVSDLKQVKDAVLFVEGPNEPNRSQERFEYKGHGFSHSAGTTVGEGWTFGVLLFMEDLYNAVNNDPLIAHLPVANSAPADGGWYYPTPSDNLADKAAAKGKNMTAFLDYANTHKYHMNYPESPRTFNLTRPQRRLVGDYLKPFVTTEMGYNTSTVSHDITTEDGQANFILRNYAFTFHQGFRHSYKFALKSEEGGHSFGIVRGDNSKKPSFYALKNLIALVKDDVSSIPPAELMYSITGEVTGVYQSLLQKSDGKFLLLVWQGNGTNPTDRNVTLTFGGTVTSAKIYEPKTADTPISAYTNPTSINLLLKNHPVVIEITGSSSSDTTPPAIPTGLAATSGSASVSLNWNDNTESDLAGYNVYRSTTSGSGFAKINSSTVTTSDYNDNAVSGGSIYYYVVRALDNSGNESANSIQASATVASNLPELAQWLYDQNGNDATGNYPLTLTNGATFTTGSHQGTHALSLDGTNDFANAGTINLGNQFTFSSWVYINSGRTNIQTIFANAAGGTAANGFKLFVNGFNTSDRKIMIESGNGSNGNSASTATNVVAYATWVHIAVTVSRTNGIAEIYYNGNKATVDNTIRADFGNNNNTRLGAMNTQYYLGGRLDDTRIYNRVLTAQEISNLYSGQSAAAARTRDTEVKEHAYLKGGQESVSLYPNPTGGVIKINAAKQMRYLKIRNTSGEIVFELILLDSTSATEIDMAEISSGIYMIELGWTDGTISRTRIVRQ
jgi:hypothetical protein